MPPKPKALSLFKNKGVSKRALQLWKSIQIYTEDIHNVLNCHNVAEHCKFDTRNIV
jgi:hypothetical protein